MLTVDQILRVIRMEQAMGGSRHHCVTDFSRPADLTLCDRHKPAPREPPEASIEEPEATTR